MAIAPDIMERLLVELCRFLIEVADLAREGAPMRTPEIAAHEAECAAAAVDTIRQAIVLRDREIARDPLRQVAARLGIELEEEDPDWQRLAFRALRVMLDVEEENARRDRGVFNGPSAAFRAFQDADRGSARVRPQTILTAPRAMPVASEFAAAPRDTVVESPRAADPRPVEHEIESRSEEQDGSSGSTSQAAANSTPESEADISSLRLEEYFDLYIAKKLEGYTDDFGEEEVPDEAAGQGWRKSSKNNMEVGKRLWVGLLGNRPFLEISDEDIREAKKTLRRLPETQVVSRGMV